MSDEEYALLSKNARASIKNFDHEKYYSDFERLKNDL